MLYKSKRIIDGKPIWTVVDETSQIVNRNPSKDDLEGLEKEIVLAYTRGNKKVLYYNNTNTCEFIEKNGERCKEKLKPRNARREHDKDGIFSGRWLCEVHGNRHRDKTYGKSYIHKSLAGCRTDNLDTNCYKAIGNLFEELTCNWKKVKSLNIENDNYEVPIDHTADIDGKIPQTGGRSYNSIRGFWPFTNLKREWEKKFDYMICYCANEDITIIERIYIFPKEEINGRTGITILKNPSKGALWYEKYRITDEKIIETVNNIWKKIIGERK